MKNPYNITHKIDTKKGVVEVTISVPKFWRKIHHSVFKLSQNDAERYLRGKKIDVQGCIEDPGQVTHGESKKYLYSLPETKKEKEIKPKLKKKRNKKDYNIGTVKETQSIFEGSEE